MSKKFRIRDEITKKWVKPIVEFVPTQSSNNYKSMFLEVGDFPNDASNLIVQQFTGLHDKNGKEIYEYDLMMHGGKPEAVVFCEGTYCLNNLTMDLINPNEEVVGNVFENPELYNLRD